MTAGGGGGGDGGWDTAARAAEVRQVDQTRMITAAEAARRWGVTSGRVRQWLAQGRVAGAVVVTVGASSRWAIPAGAKRPARQPFVWERRDPATRPPDPRAGT